MIISYGITAGLKYASSLFVGSRENESIDSLSHFKFFFKVTFVF